MPGLYKIFDEILVNAADNKQRDKNMDAMKVMSATDPTENSFLTRVKILYRWSCQDHVCQEIFGSFTNSHNLISISRNC